MYIGGLCIISNAKLTSRFKRDQRGREWSWVLLNNVILCWSTQISIVLSEWLWIANKISQSFFWKFVQIWTDLKNERYMVVLLHMISLIIFFIPSAKLSWVLLLLGLPQFSINWSVGINSQKVSSVWFHRLYSLASSTYISSTSAESITWLLVAIARIKYHLHT